VTGGSAALSELGLLVEECLARVDRDGPAAVDAVCAEHPLQADALRRRIDRLRDLGLLDRGRIGPYRLLRVLGVGGMGVVHLARDERLQRVVALKVLPERLSLQPRAVERFEREMRAVARLSHERIVPIYDVSETEGVPYFTMEYVEGRTLADTLAALRATGRPAAALTAADVRAAARVAPGEAQAPALALAQAAAADGEAAGDAWGASYVECACRLAIDLADALEHAHARGIVHRDVKPSNVLVRRDGHALLFDFGLARLDASTDMTRSGDFTGTPAYMSPEQLRGVPDAIDRRTDVYSLGVVLYELLTLHRAFGAESPQGMLERILRADPTPPRSLNRLVPADLEVVCLTATEKEPTRRYQTAGELAADLRRVLALVPVRARPVPAWERLLRRARRRRAATLALALSIVVAVGVPVGLWRSNVAVRAERDRAEEAGRQARRAAADASMRLRQSHRLSELMLGMLGSPVPGRDGREVRVVDILDRTAGLVGEVLAGEPHVEIAFRNVLGNSYRGLGQLDAAREQYEAARALFDSARGTGPGRDVDAADRAVTLSNLGSLAGMRGDLEAAVPLLQAGVEAYREAGPEWDRNLAQALSNLAAALATGGEHGPAAAALEESCALLRSLPAEDARLLIEAECNLAILHSRTGREEQAEASLRRLAGQARARLPSDDPLRASVVYNLGILCAERGAYDEGETFLREAVEVHREGRGDDDPLVASWRLRVAAVLLAAERPQAAEREVRQVTDRLARIEPDGGPLGVQARWRLGASRLAQDDPAGAEAAWRAAIATAARAPARTWEPRWQATESLARHLAGTGRPDEATRLLADVADAARADGGADASETAARADALAVALADAVPDG
jgi:serine/threonine protein kinase